MSAGPARTLQAPAPATAQRGCRRVYRQTHSPRAPAIGRGLGCRGVLLARGCSAGVFRHSLHKARAGDGV